MAVTDVTQSTFVDEVLMADGLVVVDYWADWCAPCKQMSPIIDELAKEHGEKVTFLKLDTNANPDTPVKYGVLGLPTIQIFSGGEVVKSFTGGKTKAALIRAIEEFI